MFKEWNRAFDRLRHQHDTWYIFRDFLDMTIDNFTIPGCDPLFKNKDRYTEEEYEWFGDLWTAYVEAMNEALETRPYYDFLGSWWESDVNMTNKFKAQFFTPLDVTDLMVQLTLTDDLSDEPRVMYDCCCGSGRFGLSWNHARPQDYYAFQDLDDYAVKMTIVNMLMHGMRGVVAHMNTLTRECFWCCRVSPYGDVYGLPYVVPYGRNWRDACRFLPKQEYKVEAPKPSVTHEVTGGGGLDAWL